jgi:hypothetical protein
MLDEVECLDAALEGRRPATEVPESVREMLAVAVEVGDALAAPVLTPADRERLYRRALHGRGWGGRLRHDLPRLARRPTVVGGAAAVIAVVGIALLRGRSHHELGAAA